MNPARTYPLEAFSMKFSHLGIFLLLLGSSADALGQVPEFLNKGQAIDLDKAIPANERGILCLTQDARGRIFGGTTGRAAHLFVYNPAKGDVRSLARLEGGIGFAHGLVRLPDGAL